MIDYRNIVHKTKIELADKIAKLSLRFEIDKMGKPLYYHAQAVAKLGKTEDEIIVGFLHDTIEDNPKEVTYQLIYDLFNEKIAKAVMAITRLPNEPYDNYIRKAARNPLAVRVKLNDLTHNMDRKRWPSMPDDYYQKLLSAKEYLQKR